MPLKTISKWNTDWLCVRIRPGFFNAMDGEQIRLPSVVKKVKNHIWIDTQDDGLLIMLDEALHQVLNVDEYKQDIKENKWYTPQEILSEFNNIRAAQCLIDTMTKAFQCEGLQPLYYCDFIPNCPDELVAMGAVTKERLKKAKRKVAKEARINRKIRELENEKNKLMV